MDSDERYERYLAEVVEWRRRAVRSRRPIVWAGAGVLALALLASTFYQVHPKRLASS